MSGKTQDPNQPTLDSIEALFSGLHKVSPFDDTGSIMSGVLPQEMDPGNGQIQPALPSSAVLLTNQTGSDQAIGTVVVIDTANAESFVLSTDPEQTDRTVGVLLEEISDGGRGLVQVHGYVELVNVLGAPSIGDKLYISATPGYATADPVRGAGAFSEVIDTATESITLFDYAAAGENNITPGWPAPDAANVDEGYSIRNLGDAGSTNPAPENHATGAYISVIDSTATSQPNWTGLQAWGGGGSTTNSRRAGWGLLESYSGLVHLMDAGDGDIGASDWQLHIRGRIGHVRADGATAYAPKDFALEFFSSTNAGTVIDGYHYLVSDLLRGTWQDFDETLDIPATAQSFSLISLSQSGSGQTQHGILFDELFIEVIRPLSVTSAILWGAPDDASATDTHIADTSDAHDASAISILDTAADFTATDVEGALAELQTDAEAHLADAADAHDASAISILDAANDFTATDVEGALAELQSDAEDHLADASDAHDASSISVLDTALHFTGTDVEAVLDELADSIAGSGIPATIVDAKGDLIVATAADTVTRRAVGTDGQMLTADAAEADGVKWTTPADASAHIADASDAHDASAVSVLDTAGEFTGTDVEAALAELTLRAKYAALEVVLGNGTDVITTGVKGYVRVPFACVIVRASLFADASGSIVVDIWRDTYANFPPLVADTITAAAKPTLSAAQKAEDVTLTGWSTTCAEGTVLGFNVDSATTVKQVTLELRVRKT